LARFRRRAKTWSLIGGPLWGRSSSDSGRKGCSAVDLDAFADLVTEALESLPEEFLEKLENVQVDIEEWPSPNDLLDAGLSARSKHSLLGLYHGVPMTERGIYYMAFPDRISIYQKPIEAMTGPDEERIREQVRRTVIHEIAHYYGISDERLDELGWG
jgi:predicted Zn-dependent protease with MMP-like domain